MDTNRLVVWAIGSVLIAIGVPLFYLGRYFSAVEKEKKRKARDLQIIAIAWMAIGVILYLIVLFTRSI